VAKRNVTNPPPATPVPTPKPKAATTTTPAAARPPAVSPGRVAERLLRSLRDDPILRQRFIDPAGAMYPGVESSCDQSVVLNGRAVFSCVVWRTPGASRDGLRVVVTLLPHGVLGLDVNAP
jgi:hypothetical protein